MKQEIQKFSNKSEGLSFKQIALRVAIPSVLLGLYIASFPAVYHKFGEAAAMLLLIPVCTSAWLWKFRIGILSALLGIPVNGLLFAYMGLGHEKNFADGIPSFITELIVAGAVGWLSELSEKYKLLAFDFRTKHNDLEAEIKKRKEVEEELSLLNTHLKQIVDRRTKELVDAKNRAEESDRMKSDFLTQMSHEIRTPLSNIINYTSLVKDITGDKFDEALGICFAAIESSSSRIIRTIEMIINVSQIQQNKYVARTEPLDLEKDILDPLVREMHPAASNKGLELVYEPAGVSEKVLADQYALMQIFDNLLDNAIKFTKNGRVELRTVVNEEGLAVVVSDTGIGISEEYMKRLFEPFSQEESGYSRRYEGNGLGLALAKKYCELNNASISVKSEKNKGSEFKVLFSSMTSPCLNPSKGE